MTEKLKENKNTIISIVLAVLGAGGLSYAFKYWDQSSKRDDDYIHQYIDCNNEKNKLISEISEIKVRLSVLEYSTADIPFPFWIKDENGVIIHVSKAYVKEILDPLNIKITDMLNTKGEALGSEFVELILYHDNQVRITGETLKFNEMVPKLGMGISYKFPVYNKYGKFKGTGGIWIPNE